MAVFDLLDLAAVDAGFAADFDFAAGLGRDVDAAALVAAGVFRFGAAAFRFGAAAFFPPPMPTAVFACRAVAVTCRRTCFTVRLMTRRALRRGPAISSAPPALSTHDSAVPTAALAAPETDWAPSATTRA
ncbi:MAG: hypothetical protein ABJC51_01770, partial [Acidobacteriota bacterium]